ncbi:MAG: cytochrome c biogenesis protein CcmG/thiol:disulfide interchange protein DsbE [Alteromonadaceae bacterium]|jgi:cytochrome c biogenesis protein CcmG/thiol:disulfide interchange protein DsbE
MNEANQGNKLWFFLVPLGFFLVLAFFLFQGLYADPRQRDSVIVNKTLPVFALNDLMDEKKTWHKASLIGETFLLNVWGTWCVTCDRELPYLTTLRQQGIKIIGLYYDQSDPDFGESLNIKQLRAGVNEKLSRLGDPYQFNMFDESRGMLLDLGVTGAPETFLVDKQGVIRVHHLGDVNPRVWERKFAALYTQLSKGDKQ